MPRNEKNVAALTEGIEAASPLIDPSVARMIAIELAARGVLVPSVITADDCEGLPLDMFPTIDALRAAQPELVAGLERIARGEG